MRAGGPRGARVYEALEYIVDWEKIVVWPPSINLLEIHGLL